MALQLSIIIAGAGIGGLVAAVALRRAGHKVTILEKHRNKNEVGFAVTISPNAARVLQSLGVDFTRARVVRCTEDAIIQASPTQYPFKVIKGTTLEELERRYGIPWMTVHRIDLWNELRHLAIEDAEAGEPVDIRQGASVHAFDTSGSVALVDGTTLNADIVIAADGVKSTAYKAVVADGIDRPATYTGVSNVRFCVPTTSLVEDPELHQYIDIAPQGSTVTVGAEPNRLILRYPCRDGLLQNFGLYADIQRPPSTEDAPSRLIANEDALERIQGFHPSLHRLIDHSTENLYLWNCVDRDGLPRYANSRLIVLGDAAHPMLPTLGSGAGMAIEDGGVLGVVLSNLDRGSEVGDRLHLWDRLRRPRGNAIQLLSRTLSVEYELSKEIKDGVRQYLSEAELADFSRKSVNEMIWSYDCLGEAERALLGRVDSPHRLATT